MSTFKSSSSSLPTSTVKPGRPSRLGKGLSALMGHSVQVESPQVVTPDLTPETQDQDASALALPVDESAMEVAVNKGITDNHEVRVVESLGDAEMREALAGSGIGFGDDAAVFHVERKDEDGIGAL